MLVSDFDYHLPKELISQKPIKPRDQARLLVLDRLSGEINHHHFYELPIFFKKGDLLVFNDTKVFKARLCGGRVEIFLLRPINRYDWEVLARPGKRLTEGTVVVLSKNLKCVIKKRTAAGPVIVKFNKIAREVLKETEKIGYVPLPPYIKEPARLGDYQTIYAKHIGSVAAPTAGFHFTKPLLSKLKKMGVKTAFVTLHVGLGTFLPVKTEKVEDHKMHSEWVEVTKKAVESINKAKQQGCRVIAVGTTTVRALEGVVTIFHPSRGIKKRDMGQEKHLPASLGRGGKSPPYHGDVNLFITPGFQFKIIDGLITNFHLPKSTLLMLVSAFAGREKILKAYQEAIDKKYKFFSFGDAMLIN